MAMIENNQPTNHAIKRLSFPKLNAINGGAIKKTNTVKTPESETKLAPRSHAVRGNAYEVYLFYK